MHTSGEEEGGKGRMYNGAADAAKQIYTRSGVQRGLYAGLSAAYLRQWTYGAGRLGIYAFLLQEKKATKVRECGTCCFVGMK